MKFSEWLEKRLSETLNPKLDALKRKEQQLLMGMEMRKDSRGMTTGINKAGYISAANELKEVRAKIKELEGESQTTPSSGKIKPIPDWIRDRKAV